MKVLKVGFGFLVMVLGCATTGAITRQAIGSYEPIAVDLAKGVDFDSVMIIGKAVVCDTNASKSGGVRLSGGKTETSMASVLYVFLDVPEGTKTLKLKIEYQDLSKEDPVAGILGIAVAGGVFDKHILRAEVTSESFILDPARYVKDGKVAMWITAVGWDHLELAEVELEYLKKAPPQEEKRIIYQNRYWQAWGDRDVYFYFFPGPCYWRHRGYYLCYYYDPAWYYTWRLHYYRIVVCHVYVYHYHHHDHHYYDCDYGGHGSRFAGPLASVGAPREPLAVVGSRRALVKVGGSTVNAQTQPNYHNRVRVWKDKEFRVTDRSRIVRNERRDDIKNYRVKKEARRYLRPQRSQTEIRGVKDVRRYSPQPPQKPQKPQKHEVRRRTRQGDPQPHKTPNSKKPKAQ